MSLILDALRKLERERDANEPPGVLVVGSVPWGETSRTRRLVLVAAAAGVLALAMLAGWLLRPVPRAPAAAAPSAPPPVPAPATPAPTPPPATLPAAVVPADPTAPPIRLSRPVPTPQPRVLPPSTTTSKAPEASFAPGTSAEPDASQPATAGEPLQPAAPGAQGARPAAPGDDLRLTAISQRDGRPVALINDRLVFEGDSFDGITVIRIGDAEVEVEVKGQRRVIRF
jgi:hypothetical protein